MHIMKGHPVKPLTAIILPAVLLAANPPGCAAAEFDYSKDKVLHVVGTAHLDTQWRWTIQTTINEYIPNTLHKNFALFEKYPDYVFSFEGAFRYMLAKEYYPDDYARLKDYIAKGRWAVCGSSVDAGDVNVPSPESVMRHILYGNGYFRKEFGRTSRDIFLPDCFGFGYALPSIMAHCGLKGFSSQKLTWGSAIGIPFDVGAWEGVDGSRVVAELNPDEYVARLRTDLSTDKRWNDTIEKQGKTSGLHVGYKYFGVGDTGGAPDDESVSWLEKSMKGTGPLKVVSVPADRLACELHPAQLDRLPQYKGELLMSTHGTGCYTAQSAMKRWNRRNELLADGAERASVIADWFGGAVYPGDALRETWIRFLWHQFHDDLTGTSIPEAYTFSWNDEIIALNRFSSILEHAAGAGARALDTRAKGIPLVVYNPLAFEREDAVEATVSFPGAAPKFVRVFGPDGAEVPAQVVEKKGAALTVLFLAKVPSVGYAVYDARPSATPSTVATGIAATASSLENARYRVRIDRDGNVAGITDKRENRELLSAPARLDLFDNLSKVWPAWEITYDTVAAKPLDYLRNPSSVRVVESGPARVSVEVVRSVGDSRIVQYIRLAAGSDRVEFDTDADWRTRERLLKATFPLAVSNAKATYDLGLGTIQRGNNTEKIYEVPAQQWADITTPDAAYGVSIMNDCRYGWDKPDESTLRLTLLHTPKPGSYSDQALLDIGRHRFTYAVSGHKACWRAGLTVREAARLNQPLVAFRAPAHEGTLGRTFSMFGVSAPGVFVRAFKKAEESDEYIVRLGEMHGRKASGVKVTFAAPVLSARELNGAEEPVGDATVKDGALVTDFAPNAPRTFAVKLAAAPVELAGPESTPVELPFTMDGVSLDGDRADGDFSGSGHTYPGELLPAELTVEGVTYKLGSGAPGAKNVLACAGQTIQLPAGAGNRVSILASAVGGDATGVFKVGAKPVTLKVQDYTGFIGQWDSRFVNGRVVNTEFGLSPAYIKRDRVAWVGTHRHNRASGNEAYTFCYLFRYTIDLPAGARTLTLPNNPAIRVFAVSVSKDPGFDTVAARPLYDEARSTAVRLSSEGGAFFVGSDTITLAADPANAVIRYTLDGSNPGPSSPVYAGPVTLKRTTTLKARAYSKEIPETNLFAMTFTRLEPVAPVANPGALVPGIRCDLYTGSWDALPDFTKLTPVKSEVATTIAFPRGVPADRFGLRFTGFIDIPKDGAYTFYSASDDGSRIYIGDRLVVDNDGLHGPDEVSGGIALLAGKHPITVVFFEKDGGEALTVQYDGPGIVKQAIPAERLFVKE